MLLNDVAKWRESTPAEKGEFKLTALYSGSLRGFVVYVTIDGKGDLFISSQRQERRVFKTLDALRRATKAAGIPWFEVVG